MTRILIASLLLGVTFTPSAIAQDEQAAVTAAFEGYRTALVERDGAAALRFLLPSAAAFYEECRVAAIEMPAATLRARGVIFRYTVLDIRHRHTLAQARATSGQAILREAVSDGRVGSNISQVQTGAVEVRGDRALIELRAPSGGVMRARLRRVGGRWKFDLLGLITAGERAADSAFARIAGGDTNAGMLQILSQLTGRPIDESVWQPLAR